MILTSRKGSVLLDRQDSSKFKRLNGDPIKLTLKTLKKTEAISQTTYEKLFPTGSRTGILHEFPKIHKNNVPFRPILSSINTHSYKIAKFLVPFLRPISSGIYVVRDSFFFSRVTQLIVSF